MPEENKRYNRIVRLNINYILPECSVKLQKGVLLWDSKLKKCIMQLKFLNDTNKKLKSLYIKYRCKDDSGKIIESTKFSTNKFAYIDENCEPYSVFGNKQAIVLESELIRDVDVFIEKIVWEDNSITTIIEEDYVRVNKQNQLNEILSKEEILLYYKVCGFKEDELFCPEKLENHVWRCACGSINRGNICPECRVEKEKVFYYLDRKKLREYEDVLIKQQEEYRVEQEQIRLKELEKKRIKEEKRELIGTKFDYFLDKYSFRQLCNLIICYIPVETAMVKQFNMKKLLRIFIVIAELLLCTSLVSCGNTKYTGFQLIKRAISLEFTGYEEWGQVAILICSVLLVISFIVTFSKEQYVFKKIFSFTKFNTSVAIIMFIYYRFGECEENSVNLNSRTAFYDKINS